MSQTIPSWVSVNEKEKWKNFKRTAKMLDLKGSKLKENFIHSYPCATFQSISGNSVWTLGVAKLIQKQNGQVVLGTK
jgi:hypothetical protein